MVALPDKPCAIESDVGLTAIEKSFAAAAVTVTLSAAVCEPDPAVPVTVSVYVPATALELTASESVALWPELTELGVMVAVTPAGAPETLSETF